MLSIRVLPRQGVIPGAAISAAEIMTVLVVAHGWAGGELPGAGWLVATAALVFGIGTVVLRSRVPLWVLVPALTAAQLLLHGWMVALAPTPHAAVSYGAGSPGAGSHATHLELTWQMVVAHVVGAVATAMVWELRRRAVHVVLAWAAVGLVPVPVLRRASARRAPTMPLRRPLTVVPLRGPPVRVLIP